MKKSITNSSQDANQNPVLKLETAAAAAHFAANAYTSDQPQETPVEVLDQADINLSHR